MKFTTEDLIEIEKMFDIAAGQTQVNFMQYQKVMDTLHALGPNEEKEHITSMRLKVFDEYVTTFTRYREISAIAVLLRKREQ